MLISPMDRRVSGTAGDPATDVLSCSADVKFPPSLAYPASARARLSAPSGLPIRLRYLRLQSYSFCTDLLLDRTFSLSLED